MPSLLDIAPPELSAETVEIRGVTLTVRGVRADEWAILYSRFPELRALVSGRDDDAARDRLYAAQAALIAAGTGYIGNAEIERAAMMNLGPDDFPALVDRILRLTNPGDLMVPLLDGAASGSVAVARGREVGTK